jgi:hypothetical protein
MAAGHVAAGVHAVHPRVSSAPGLAHAEPATAHVRGSHFGAMTTSHLSSKPRLTSDSYDDGRCLAHGGHVLHEHSIRTAGVHDTQDLVNRRLPGCPDLDVLPKASGLGTHPRLHGGLRLRRHGWVRRVLQRMRSASARRGEGQCHNIFWDDMNPRVRLRTPCREEIETTRQAVRGCDHPL